MLVSKLSCSDSFSECGSIDCTSPTSATRSVTACATPQAITNAADKSERSSCFITTPEKEIKRQAATTSMPTTRSLESQARIDYEVQQVDNQIDHDEDQRDQTKIGGHHRDVGEGHGLDEQQAHSGPLEHRLSDDRERDQRAELQPGDGDDGHERVLQRMAEVHDPVGQAARTRELDVVRTQHLEHLGAYE